MRAALARILTLAACAFAGVPGHAASSGASYISTPKISRIYDAPAGYEDAFLTAKSKAAYCYIEADMPAVSAAMVGWAAAAKSNGDNNSRMPVALTPSPCLDGFNRLAARKEYKDSPVYSGTFEYRDFRVSFIRYVAACMYERDRAAIVAKLANTADHNGIFDFLKNEYRDGDFDAAGSQCAPDFVTLRTNDLTFTYALVQQFLLRRGID